MTDADDPAAVQGETSGIVEDIDRFHARRIDTTKPSAARMYDWFLDGDGPHNYMVDRLFGQQVKKVCPFVHDLATHNRDFLGRAVRFCTAAGVDQFIDIGSGIPTRGNVHEIAQEDNRGATVVYCDNDVEAVRSSKELLAGNDFATCIEADLRQPETILDHPETQRLIDFDRPVALLIVSVLHFVGDDEDAHGLVRRYLDRLPSGSHFVASHISVDEATPEAAFALRELDRLYGSTSNPTNIRTRDAIVDFFTGLDVVEPGVTFTADWHADNLVARDHPGVPCFYAGVGRKP